MPLILNQDLLVAVLLKLQTTLRLSKAKLANNIHFEILCEEHNE